MTEKGKVRGLFVVIEGLDRCGKDTQIDIMMKVYVPSMKISFPNEDIPSGIRLRSYLTGTLQLSDADAHMLFAQNRRESLPQVLQALHEGTNVFCSRYAFSGAVYTAQKGYSLDRACMADQGILVPDLTFLLYCDVSRIAMRYGNVERYETQEIQERVRSLYLLIASRSDVGQWFKMDVTGASIEGVQLVLAQQMDQLLNIVPIDPVCTLFALLQAQTELE